jgi:sugar phosphate isomerase/epimerase
MMTNQSSGCSRRQFLARSGAGVAGAAFFLSAIERARAYPLDGVMGLQSYDVREFLREDLGGTLKTLAGWGYKALDLVVPNGQPGEPTAAQYREALDGAGMICHNGHFGAAMFQDANWANTLQVARTLGVKEMVLSGGAPSGRGQTPVTVDSWKAYAETLSQAGAKTKAEGLQLGWHNHGEFRPIDGGGGLNPFDVLLQNTDPAVVKFQIDVGNMAEAGGDPIAYLTKYPTRYYSMHVKDVSADRKIGLAVGEGVQDFKKIFELAKAANIHNFDVETGAPKAVVMEKLRMSAEFLKQYPMV